MLLAKIKKIFVEYSIIEPCHLKKKFQEFQEIYTQ